jgi:hypothetical protein
LAGVGECVTASGMRRIVMSDDATRTAEVAFDADRTVTLLVGGRSATPVGVVIL